MSHASSFYINRMCIFILIIRSLPHQKQKKLISQPQKKSNTIWQLQSLIFFFLTNDLFSWHPVQRRKKLKSQLLWDISLFTTFFINVQILIMHIISHFTNKKRLILIKHKTFWIKPKSTVYRQLILGLRNRPPVSFV